MNLSNELISRFVKATKDDKKKSTETTVYGTTVVYDGKTYVKLDGSDLLTPVTTTTDVKSDERVTVMIKDHTATITGNISSPAARTDDVKDVASKISEFEIIVAHRVSTEELEAINATIQNLRADLINVDKLNATSAYIETLEAKFADVEYLNANDIEAITATIESLEAIFGSFTDLSADQLEALNAEIQILKGHSADFTYVSAEVLEAMKAQIKDLNVDNLNAKYANIDFANIGEAAIRKLFSDSGLIKDLVVSDGTITGELVGVTIKGDLIEGNTVKADKLVVKGSDGIYYKLNFEAGTFKEGEAVPDDGIHGSVIVANTITAEKINVDDLVAFEADIGGLHIANGSIYSGVKDSATNTTRGVYLGSDGQVAFGDSSNYLKYYKDQNGQYRLEISAASIVFGASSKPIEDAVSDLVEEAVGDIVVESMKDLEVGGRNKIRNSATLLFDSYYFSGPLIHVNDGLGALEITCGANCTTDEKGTCTIHTLALDAHNGLGTVILNDNYSGITAILGRGIIGTMIIGKET